MKKRSWIVGLVVAALLALPVMSWGQGVSAPSQMRSTANVVGRGDMVVPVKTHNLYVVECFDKYGNLKWREEFPNLVVNGGLDMLLNTTFKSAVGSTTWYVGLVGTTSTGFAAADTQTTHAGWAENWAYTLSATQNTRPALTLGTVSGGSVTNSASVAAFTMNATTTIYGAAIFDAISGTGGTWGLYGEGAFSSSRAVISGDIINVTITLSITASDASEILYEYLPKVAENLGLEPYQILALRALMS